MTAKVNFVLCVCTGDCPGFSKMNVWDLINQVRLTLPVEWGIVHPQLCEQDGDRFLANILKEAQENQEVYYFIAGCSPNMQMKMFGPAFKEAGLDISKKLKPLDVRNMTTDEAYAAIEKALKEWGILSE